MFVSMPEMPGRIFDILFPARPGKMWPAIIILRFSAANLIFAVMIHCTGVPFSFFFVLLLFADSLIAQPGSMSVHDTVISRSGGRDVYTIRFPGGDRAIQRFKDGKKDGVQELYGQNGKLAMRDEWKKGFRNGTLRRYDRNGLLTEKEQYVFVEDSGKSYQSGWKEEYVNGRLRKRQKLAFDMPDGILEEFSPQGQLVYRVFYTLGLENGLEEKYSNSAQLLLKGFNKIVIRNGKKVSVPDGEWSSWNNDGVQTSVTRYREGVKDGRSVEFYQDGKKKSEIEYKRDKPHGQLMTWFPNGFQERVEIQYADTVVNGKRQAFVFDGERRHYFQNGNLQLREFWTMGVKQGTFEKFYENGKLRERVTYRANLKEGKEDYFDQEGILSSETFYVIRQVGDSLVSVRDGAQRSWKKGVLVSETFFVNDAENGVRRQWFENGTPASQYEVEDGIFSGDFSEFYESGKLKRKGRYKRLAHTGGSRKYTRAGWQCSYDEDGYLLAKYWPDTLDNTLLTVTYSRNKLQQFDYNRMLSVACFPDGSLKSFVLRNIYGQEVSGLWFFLNHRIRKCAFGDPGKGVVNTLLFDDEGRYVSQASMMHEQADSMRSSAEVVRKILSVIPQDLHEHPFFTDSVRQGTYVLKYRNGADMARVNFKADLPEGDWLLLDPLTADTLIYRFFVNGEERGYYVDKFGGSVVLRRGRMPDKDKPGWEETYTVKGVPVQSIKYKVSRGNYYERTEYHENGRVKSFVNNETGANSSYAANGIPFYIYDFIGDSLKRYREYHPGSEQLKALRFYRGGKLDSVSLSWHDNGKLQSELWYRNGIREGKAVTYGKTGDTLTSGTYVNDQLEGWMMDRTEGATRFHYYENNKRVVNPGDYPCACVDTLYPSGRVKFAQTIGSLLEYEKLQNYFAPWMSAADSLNYKSVFFTGLQTDNRNGSGFAGFNLMLFKEFAIDLPANKQLRLVLNPCRTKGYISRLETTLSYTENPRSVNVDFRPQRIELQLISGPVMSAIRQYPHPTLLVNTRAVSYSNPGGLRIDESPTPNHCMTPVRIRKRLRLDQLTADYALFSRPDGLAAGYLLSSKTVKQEELKSFFGMTCTGGQCFLNLSKNSDSIEVTGIVKAALLGGEFAAGYLQIPYVRLVDGQLYFRSDRPLSFNINEIETLLINDGFRRVNATVDSTAGVINIYWFAE